MTSEFSYNYSIPADLNKNNVTINQTNFLSYNNTYNDNPYNSNIPHTWYVKLCITYFQIITIFVFRADTEDFESRKTKSKENARNRRNKENEEIKTLSSMLPLQFEIAQQLDKASIIRLVISYIKIRKFFNESKLPSTNTGISIRKI